MIIPLEGETLAKKVGYIYIRADKDRADKARSRSSTNRRYSKVVSKLHADFPFHILYFVRSPII